jgi:hypothetical protein
LSAFPEKSSNGVQFIFKVLKCLADNQHLNFVLGSGDDGTIDGKSEELNIYNPNVLRHFKEFAGRAWWGRAWVVQEVILPPSATMICGSYSLAWDQVEIAARSWYQHSRDCCRFQARTEYSEIHQFFQQVLALSRAKRFRLQNKHNSVVTTLLTFSSRTATDPRDRIFAYLGLFPDTINIPIASQIIVDYTVCKEHIYKEMIRLNILITDSLDILIHPTPNSLDNLANSSPDDPKLRPPSWAIDWTLPVRPFGVTKVAYERSLHYHASRGKGAAAIFSPDSTLSLSGIFIDKVRRVGKPVPNISWPKLLETAEWWENIMLSCLRSGEHIDTARYPAGGSVRDAYWRTLLGNLISTADYHNDKIGDEAYRALEAADFVVYEQWWKSAKAGEATFDAFGYQVLGTFLTKTFFVTESGYFGIGPQTVKPEDEIHVLFGSNVPFVLRSYSCEALNSPSISSQIQHNGISRCYLVGDCYIHGFMNGEALEDEARKVQTVLLY